MSQLDEKGLGHRLQAARQAAGLTQQALCQRANLSYSTLAKIERGAIKSPSIFTIQSIAAALSISLDQLIGVSIPAERPTLRTKSGVGFIYFDVNDCLVRYYQRAFIRLAEISGAPVDVVETVFWHYNDDVCRGTMSMSDFNRTLSERLQIGEVDWSAYYLEAVEPITEMQELLVWAAEKYRVGLFSNVMPGLLTAMRQRQTLPDIDYAAIIDSSEIGAIKPEAKMYDIATERAGCPPNEILLIDDTRANLMAAERAGWNVLGFDSYRTEESVQHFRTALEPATA